SKDVSSTITTVSASPDGTLNLPAAAPLSIASGRLNQTILETGSQFGGVARWGQESHEFGMRRLAGTALDGAMRDWFTNECESLGCKVKVDKIGNMFAVYPGKNGGKPTATGSHLDTQPEAGKYDGILGVLAGLEVLRTFKDNNYVPNYDVCVVVWFNEEGARFARSCTGSSVWSHDLSLEEAYGLMSVGEDKPESVYDSLKNIGYIGDTPASYKENEIDAHFELHIEQGPILEDENKAIGIVTGVQAYNWQKVTVHGVGAHAGTTPWRLRKDALLMSSKMIVAASEIAQRHNGLFTCGIIDAKPYSVNIIPGEVSFTLDFRHPSDDVLATMLKEAAAEFDRLIKINDGGALSYESETLQVSPAVNFHEVCIECVSRSAFAQFKKDQVRQIWSGAGHDSCQTAPHVPTSMIFIPSKDGLSHNYYEYSSPEEIENGFKVLLQAIINYDNYRVIRGHHHHHHHHH
nr:Chain A, beta-alanine synthase [Lachancea kluyveri]1R3N_B Chain B, beta-alanine synthase [Lachancea kluyveri]1R3N_C Chain C, beta-alanine synthase [Lachancea kluyveri]1R3N_D Chain D, beta-alanine synthase [Lachancea kluyveri]1R3N_E Chain E, beta-alanine synthase [Lachancea kluyveri]1R3N_F Chain F, beta-alanine synthase [Lachancea kluyveri]1R3N_G Chain G, beta-alanine synthase [Lachancea kluyveri]1R3N_H Chain H, beta-alanine synthase [Lachancea kluyveri]